MNLGEHQTSISMKTHRPQVILEFEFEPIDTRILGKVTILGLPTNFLDTIENSGKLREQVEKTNNLQFCLIQGNNNSYQLVILTDGENRIIKKCALFEDPELEIQDNFITFTEKNDAYSLTVTPNKCRVILQEALTGYREIFKINSFFAIKSVDELMPNILNPSLAITGDSIIGYHVYRLNPPSGFGPPNGDLAAMCQNLKNDNSLWARLQRIWLGC